MIRTRNIRSGESFSRAAENSVQFRATSLLGALLLLACGGGGEARDPSDIFGEFSDFDGADTAAAPLADQASCRRAAERVEELALELVVAEEADPAERQKLEARARAERSSAAFRERVEHGAEECLGRETTAAEASCIARVKTASDLERCTGN